MTVFDRALDFPIRIMLICDVALDSPIQAHHHPEFPCFNLRTAQSRANDWNVVLSADRARVKPVKRRLPRRTDRFCCGQAESANKILFRRLARSDLVDLFLCDRFGSRCVTRYAGERYKCEYRVDSLTFFVHRMNCLRYRFCQLPFPEYKLLPVCRDRNSQFQLFELTRLDHIARLHRIRESQLQRSHSIICLVVSVFSLFGFVGGQRAIPAASGCNTRASIRPCVFVAGHAFLPYP
jgi:hypothetical protein